MKEVTSMMHLTIQLIDDEKIEHDIRTWELRERCLTFVTVSGETIGIPLVRIKEFVIIPVAPDLQFE